MIDTNFKKIWESLKTVLLPVLVLLAFFFAGRNFLSQLSGERNSFAARLQEMQRIQEDEMKKILDAQSQERQRHEQNLKQLQQDLDTAIVKHEEKLKELERQKQEEGRRLLEKYKDDPVGLAREMGRVTGIPVYVDSNTKK